MEKAHSFMPLLVVVGLAFIVPLTLSRLKTLRVPIVVGEILAGVIVGRSGFKFVTHEDPLLTLLSELGFVFLMFLSGMEVDFSALTLSRQRGADPAKQRWGPVGLGLLSFAVTLLLSSAVGIVLWKFEFVRNPWMMALILSTTSLGVVVPVLKEHGISNSRYGQTVLVAALIADLATMVLITVLVALLSHGATARILFIGVLFGIVFLMYRLGLVINRVKAVRCTLEELSHATAQIKVRAAFAMMLVFVALSQVLGTEVILGAFMAGAIVALLRNADDERLLHQLEGIGFGFFIPIFFVMVGVNFNLPILFASRDALWLLPMLLAAAIVVKLAPSVVFRLAFPWRESLAAGTIMSARLSLIIAAAAIGSQLGIITEAVNAAIIMVAIVTVTVAPPVFLKLVPGHDPKKSHPIAVVGAGELGLHVAEQLRGHREQVVVIDADAERAGRARQRGFEAVVATADRRDPALDAVLDRVQALVCTYNDTELTYRICEFARTQFGIDNIVAQVTDPTELTRFQQLGVTTMNAAIDRAALLVMLARNPAAYALLSRTDDDKEVWEVVIQNGTFAGQTLRELKLPGDVMILAMRRKGELLVPHGNTRLEHGDRLTLAGSLDAMESAREMFT